MELKEIISNHHKLPDNVLDAVCKAAVPVVLDRGDTLVRQGERCDIFVFVSTGMMRVWMKEKEKEDTVAFGTAGDIFTSLHSFYNNDPSAFSLSAIGKVKAWTITYDAINTLLDTYPELVRWLLNLALGQIYCLERRYVNFSSMSAEERYLNFVGYFNKDTRQAHEPWFAQRIPFKYIAQYLGIAPTSLSRLRRKLITDTDR